MKLIKVGERASEGFFCRKITRSGFTYIQKGRRVSGKDKN